MQPCDDILKLEYIFIYPYYIQKYAMCHTLRENLKRYSIERNFSRSSKDHVSRLSQSISKLDWINRIHALTSSQEKKYKHRPNTEEYKKTNKKKDSY